MALIDQPPRRRHRRDPRLGPLPLPGRRLRAGRVRRHPPLRARRPAPGLPPRLEQPHLQLRPPRGAQLPRLVGRALALDVPRRRPAGRRRRVDALPRLLAAAGEWLPNADGGRENLEAIAFLRQLNTGIYADHPDVQVIAEESTAFPGVSRPVELGGLGFGLKWDMGWMHDTLDYLSRDPVHRRYHHGELTFRSVYAFSENFVLPLSHDEVVHGKGSLLAKMPGDDWQRFANLRLLYGYQFAQPGQEAPLHGRRVGPVAGVGPRVRARLGPAGFADARGHPRARGRPQPPLPRPCRRFTSSTPTRRVRVDAARRRRRRGC